MLFCDNYEDRPLGDGTVLRTDLRPGVPKTWNWDVNDGGFGSITTDMPFEGTKSFRMTYPACSWSDNQDHPCGAGFGSPSNVGIMNHNDLYVRHYTRFSSTFTWSMINVKHMFHNQSGGSRPPLLMISSGNQWFVQDEPGSSQFFSTKSVLRDTWYCVEEHMRNTSGNKLFELWIDNVQVFNLTNAQLPAGFMNTSPWTQVPQPEGHWNTNGISGAGDCTNQFMTFTPPNICSKPSAFKWYDAIVVSTARIGCLTGGPVNTTSATLTGTETITGQASARVIGRVLRPRSTVVLQIAGWLGTGLIVLLALWWAVAREGRRNHQRR